MNTQTNQQLAIVQPGELVRQSTDVAGVCKEIVLKSAMEIQGRKYVKVEGWQSIATAHGCIASSRDVEKTEDGYKAIGEVRRMSDGGLIAQAEGFVGIDEPTWFGGESEVWDKQAKRRVKKVLPPRPMYAIRAMAQTRAISRACRSAFAHIVVLMDAGLSTTPAEEVPHGGFDNDQGEIIEEKPASPAPVGDWRDHKIHFGKKEGVRLGDMDVASVKWYHEAMVTKRDKKGKYPASKEDLALLAACASGLDFIAGKSGHKTTPVAVKVVESDEIPIHVPKLIEALKWAGHSYTALQDLWPTLPQQARDMIGVQDVADENQLTEADAMKIYSAWDEVVLPALDTVAKGAKK